MSFQTTMKAGIDKIYAEDFETQKHYISVICNDVRGMKPDVIYKAKAFFIPNNEYMINYFGVECTELDYNIYNYDGECEWNNHLVFGIRNLADQVVGLVGYDVINAVKAKETGDWSLHYYKYSSKRVFDRGKYIFVLPEVYEKAIKDGYIILADGVFDMLSLVHHGYNGAALFGSFVNEYTIAYLKFIPKIYLAVDNDEAGMKVYRELKKYLPQIQLIKQNKTKDIDDFLKGDFKEEFDRLMKDSLSKRTKLDLIMRF